jgi:DMSO reductase family type II enzyme chaperone
MSTDPTSPTMAIDLARQIAYRFLALVTSDPKSRRWKDLHCEELQSAAQAAAELLAVESQCRPMSVAPGELMPDQLNFAPLIELLADPSVDLNAQYERIFGLMISKKCPPYETEYCPQTFSVYRSQALADIAGFYRAFGLEPSRDMPERADHIALELDFMSWLIAKEQRAGDPEQVAVCREAQQRFLRDHLAWWVPAFARALSLQSRSSFYSSLAQNLAAFIAAERAVLGVAVPSELVVPGPIEPHEEMDCSACAADRASL